MKPLIEVRALSKSYTVGEMEVPVLRDVSLRIMPGEYVALMGASGSGKSTLMNILGCLDRPSSGSYRLGDQEVSTLTSDERARLRNQRIGFIFQSFNLLRRASALENVMMPLEYSASPPASPVQKAEALLSKVGLQDRMHHTPSQLSGGQQQRVAIARSIVNDPAILLADEPTGNLDSRTTEDILQMFAALHREGTTILLVSHEADVAEHATRVIRIHDGSIVGDSAGGGSENR